MSVGRPALDEEAIRLIEKTHPDIRFDWTKILNGVADDQTVDEPAEPVSPAGGKTRRRPARTPKGVVDAAASPREVPDTRDATPAERRLGADGIARLRRRYSDVVRRIAAKPENAERQAELTALVERLNPDAWDTDEEVSAGLDAYEAAFEELRARLASRRQHPEASPLASPGESGELH